MRRHTFQQSGRHLKTREIGLCRSLAGTLPRYSDTKPLFSSRYQNIVTELFEVAHPPPLGGGILADVFPPQSLDPQ